jgi:hypothetical protein
VKPVLTDYQSAMSELALAYVREHGREIEQVVGRGALPTRDLPLGCGAYGCVYPTGRPGVVLKATLDQREGLFVEKAIALAQATGKFPSGIVRYDALLDTPARVPARHEGRLLLGMPEGMKAADLRLYLLWREEAYFGEMDKPACLSAHRATESYRIAMNVYRTKQRPPPVAWLRERLYEALERPGERETLSAKQVRETLLYYLENELAIADLHEGNFGAVIRERRRTCVISDPGRALFLDQLEALEG